MGDIGYVEVGGRKMGQRAGNGGGLKWSVIGVGGAVKRYGKGEGENMGGLAG